MVVLVDRAAYGAEGIMAVRHHIGNGELFHAARDGGLDDPYVSDVMRGQTVEADLIIILRAGGVMRRDDAGRYRTARVLYLILRQPP